MKKINILILFSLLTITSSLSAQELPSVAVVSLDLPVNRSAEESVLKTLANADVNVISSEELQDRLEKAKSPAPTGEVAGKFAKMSPGVSKGIETFFYENEKKAIKILQPIFDLGMNNIEVLARRPDYADQIFQSGIILIRAYQARKKSDKAKAVISLIVRNFPTQPFSASVIPPKLIKRLKQARTDLATLGTTLTLSSRGGNTDHCVAYINGFVAELNTPIAVKSNTNYHMRLDCGTHNPVVWRTAVPEGESLVVPLTSKNPMIIGIKADSLTARKEAENALLAIMFWASIDHIVGVSEHLKDDGKVLVVRIQKNEGPKWSDGANNEDVYKALVRVFPELELEIVEGVGDRSSSSSHSSAFTNIDWIGWGLVGTGLATAGGATFLLIEAKNVEDEYNTTNVSYPGAYKQSAFDEVNNQIILSWGLYGLAAGLTGYGVYRLLTHSSLKEDPTALHLSPTLSPKGNVGFQLHTRF